MKYLKKNLKSDDLEDMVLRMELTCSETENILDMKIIETSTTGYTLLPGMFKISGFNWIFKSSLPIEV